MPKFSPEQTYFREADGHTYYLKNGRLMACPTFVDGMLDLDGELDTAEFDVRLTDAEIAEICQYLTV